jgi:hypothetical protein
VTLKEFGAGCGWHPKVIAFAKNRMEIFERITADQAKALTAELGATFEDFKPYDTEWTVSFEPLPDLKILFLLVSDEEFGSEFYVYYNQNAIKYPAEDALIFSLAYITLFPHEAEVLWTNKRRRLGTQIMEKRDINQLLATLRGVTSDVARKVASKLGGEFNEISGGWCLTFAPIATLPITYEVGVNKTRILYDIDKAQWIPEVVYAFKWLYLNAVIREARKLSGDDSLPETSSCKL